jgi:hypothetical protein
MRTRLQLVIATAFVIGVSVTGAESPRALVIEARNLAYDANYRNDQPGLRSAIATLQSVGPDADASAYANYYLSWSYWALAASQVQEKNLGAALESGKHALEYARLGVAARGTDPEFLTVLANALIVVAFLDRPHLTDVLPELATVRRRALELGPDNPRTALMDAGVILNTPPERGGSRERGLARWLEALKLFEAEAGAKTADPIAPRWGYALAYAWLANLYLTMTPPQKEKARNAAETAARMRPDFWYVREQLLPKVRDVGKTTVGNR